MSVVIMDGVNLAKKIEKNLIDEHIQKKNYLVCAITIGSSDETEFFIRQKRKMATRLGVKLEHVHYDNITTKELIKKITQLNHDDLVHGIFIQHPLPKEIDEIKVMSSISIKKDIDGLNPRHFSLLATNQSSESTATVSAIMALLEEYQISLTSKHAVIIGRSTLIGKPLALLLLQKSSTVTICHKNTKDLSKIVSLADIVIVATGVEGTILSSNLKQGAILIDAGYHLKGCGDATLDKVEHLSYYTKVPGGVGPVTVVMLFSNLLKKQKNPCILP